MNDLQFSELAEDRIVLINEWIESGDVSHYTGTELSLFDIVASYGDWLYPPSVARAWACWRQGSNVASDEPIGVATFFPITPTPWVWTGEIIVNPKFRSRDVASFLWPRAISSLFSDKRILKLTGYIVPTNISALKLAESSGMFREATLPFGYLKDDNSLVDIHVYSALRP